MAIENLRMSGVSERGFAQPQESPAELNAGAADRVDTVLIPLDSQEEP